MLQCPGCGELGADDERFCPRCGSPFVLTETEPPPEDPARTRARKVHPPYAEGPLVHVARAQNQPEAELMQALLLDAGVPSLVRRARGFDVPDFLAAGPRDVLVPAGGEEVARAVVGRRARGTARAPTWVRVVALVLAVLVLSLVALGIVSAILD